MIRSSATLATGTVQWFAGTPVSSTRTWSTRVPAFFSSSGPMDRVPAHEDAGALHWPHGRNVCQGEKAPITELGDVVLVQVKDRAVEQRRDAIMEVGPSAFQIYELERGARMRDMKPLEVRVLHYVRRRDEEALASDPKERPRALHVVVTNYGRRDRVEEAVDRRE